ncbi:MULTISPECIES: hypothetical protein [Sphingobacterium]|uniref:hypothetical protein n=1 Tax=Sphingobacterium TaxID=28453 RepID=UPI0010492C8F|nr:MULTISPECIES: hypothetical protein [Sphingobacterium]MCW2259846.1 hypothetical protein [Sphingobacterium kitahiroshimense]TCR11355.1 hypothetical protein EDF67_104453 [Sphingobacterium sp. JUb78]
MKPNYLSASYSFIIILISCGLLYKFYINNVNNTFIWGIVFIVIAVFIFVFISSFKGIRIFKTEKEANKYKGKLSYNNDAYTVITYSKDIVVSWNSVEAIFYINSPPLDGEYHNKEYRIFLNNDPVIINKRPLKWYDTILPSPKKEEYPMIKIDDYYNIDFDTFLPSIERFLMIKNIPPGFLNGKFGNQVDYAKKEKAVIGVPHNKLLMTTGFYVLYDKGSHSDFELKEYRKNATILR